MRGLRKGVAVGLIAGGALWTFVGTAAAGGGGGCILEPASATGSAVDIAAMCFNTPVLYTETGSTVTWTNSDSVPHTVTGSFGSKELRPGKAARFTFAQAGVFPYACLFHPGMVGAVVVGSANALGVAVSEASPGAVDGASSSAAETQARDATSSSASRAGVALLAGAAGLVVGAAVGFALRAARGRPAAAVEP